MRAIIVLMTIEEGKIGVLLGQVGTPDAPTAKSVRAYLRKFLSDPRVIDLNPFFWKPLLHGIVLRTRPARSARMYKEIWTKEGSPLSFYSKRLRSALQHHLGEKYIVELGMAYTTTGIQEAIDDMEAKGISRLIVLPLFPQFSTATTASIFDEVYAAISGRSWSKRLIQKKNIPALSFINSYHNDPRYIHVLANHLRTELKKLPTPPDKYVITFHGLPQRYVEEGDPYKKQCDEVAQLLAKELGWNKSEWMQAFQSRFGAETWIKPYLEEVIKSLPLQGILRPCIIPLSFTTDCLETLHELGIAGRKIFEDAGGDSEQYAIIPCLNTNSAWVEFLAGLVKRESN